MSGSYECVECGRHGGDVPLPQEPRHPMHRRSVSAFLLEVRRLISRHHRNRTGCRSTHFEFRILLEPPVTQRPKRVGGRNATL